MKIKKNSKNYKMLAKARLNGFSYKKYKNNRQEDFNKLPLMFAFSDEQFNEGLKKWGLTDTPEDLKKIVSIGCGGFMRKCDIPLLENHNQTYSEENMMFWMYNNFKFAYQAFKYEMSNHEYYYTYDLTDTLEALNLTIEKIYNNTLLKIALLKAKADYWNECNKCN